MEGIQGAKDETMRLHQTLVICGAVAMALPTVAPAQEQSLPPDGLCGPRCIAFICQRLTIAYDPAVIVQDTECSPTAGSSMYQLKLYLEGQGLHCRGIEAPISEAMTVQDDDVYAIIARANHYTVAVKALGQVYEVDVSAGVMSKISSADEQPYRILLVSNHDLKMKPRGSGMIVWLGGILCGAAGIIGIVRWGLRRGNQTAK